MRRSAVHGGLLVLLGVVLWAGLELAGRAKDDPVVPPVRTHERARALRDKLDRPVSVEFDRGPLKEALGFLQDRFNITILVDEEPFKEVGIEDVKSQLVRLDKSVNVKMRTVLRRLLAQVRGDFLEQDGNVVVVPKARMTAEFLLQQPVDAAFVKVPLAEALDDLAALTGVSVVLDSSLADAGKLPITATLQSAPLEATVRVLANMAGLKTVAVDKVLYVTDAGKAEALREESKSLVMPQAESKPPTK